MQNYRILRKFVFWLLTFMCNLVSLSAISSVKVNLHDSATLSCSERCSGLVRWILSRKPTEVLAECDQTSCRSKEGYQMIHDQYLKGNLSLTITDADFTKRTWYTCQCDGKDLCDVSLRLEPPENFLQMHLGESLTLDLPVSEPVKVTFTRTGDSDPNPVRLCEVEGRTIHCDPPYEERMMFQPSLQLKDLKDSDDGVYTVVDTRNEETVSTYRITVRGDQSNPDMDKGAAVPVWVTVLLSVMGAALVAVIVVSVVVILQLRRENQQLKMKNKPTDQQTKESSL